MTAQRSAIEDLSAQLAAAQARIAELEAAASADTSKGEERFRLAAQAVEGFVFDWNPLTGTVERTGNFQALTGYSPEEAEPTSAWWQERVHPEDSGHAALNVLPKSDPLQDTFQSEFRFRHKNGTWLNLCDRGFVVRDQNGTPVRVAGTTTDVTARRRLERELKFQADILATTNDAVVALDSDLHISWLNAGAERLYGVTAQKVIGKPLTALHRHSWITPEDEQRAEEDLKIKGTWTGENIHTRRDDTKIAVHSTVNVLPDEAGGGMVAVIRDISKRKAAEAEAQRHAASLARANKDLLHFAYAVSHDLKAPLRTITNYSQLLTLRHETALDEEGRGLLRFVTEAGARMSTMIVDLVGFAEVAGAQTDPSGTASLDEALTYAEANLRSAIDEAQAVVVRNPLPMVPGNLGQLVQLFQNLIENSLKYRQPDTPPRIEVTAVPGEDSWVISVSDNGIGFEPGQAERIFGVFQRAHAGFAGTGIGLAICKRIVEGMGGTIEASSRPGEGAAFSFSLPASPSARKISGEAVPAPRPSGTPLLESAGPEVEPFEELFEILALTPCIVRDLDGRIQIFTRGAEALFGWSRGEVVGQRIYDLLRTEFDRPAAEIQAELLRNGQWSGELKKYRKDGTPVWLVSQWILYRDGSGRPRSVIEVNNDITALRTAQEAALQSSQQRDLALSAGQMGVWSWDLASDIVQWDETIEKMHGMEPGSFVRSFDAIRETIHPDDRRMVEERIGAALAQGGGEYTVEYRALRADGSVFWLRGQGTAVFRDGRPVGLVGLAWNISSRIQDEKDGAFLLRLSAELSRSSDPEEVLKVALSELGRYLELSRCSWSEVDAELQQAVVFPGYHPDTPGSDGVYKFADLGPGMQILAAGRYVTVTDAETDPLMAARYEATYKPLGARAFLGIPLHRFGQWRAFLTAVRREAHQWQDREIALVRGVAERLWPALENARLLQREQEERERFEGSFEQAAVGMAHVALDGQWLRVNQLVCEITGYSREELLASRFQAITHPDDLDSDLVRYEALKRGDISTYTIEKRYFHKNGNIVWINLTVSMIRDAAGAPRYAISVIEDISTRKIAQDALKKSNEVAAMRLAAIDSLYSAAPVGLGFVDAEMRYVRVNETLARINGVPAEGHQGRRPSEILPGEGRRIEEAFERIFRSGEPASNIESSAPAGIDGRERIWLANYAPFKGPDGAVLGVSIAVQEITEVRQSQATLIATSERLKIATESAGLGVFSWDPKEDLPVWENDRMFEITGRTREQGPVSAREFEEQLIHPDDAAEFKHVMEAAMETGNPYSSTCRMRRGDGAWRWVEFSGRFDLDSAGKPRRLTGVMADITERVEAAARTREQDEQLRLMIDSITQLAWMAHEDGSIFWYNRRWYEYTGTTFAQMEGWGWQSVHDPEYLPGVLDSWRASIRTGKLWEMEFPLRGADGVYRFFLTRVVPVRDSTGRVVRWFGTNTNVDSLRKDQDLLRESERQFRELAESLPDLVWTFGPQGDEAVYVNKHWLAYTGFKPDEIHRWSEAVHPADASRVAAAWQAALAEGRSYQTEARIRGYDGTYRWFASRAEPVRDAAGRIVKWLGHSNDVHEQKLIEQALRRSNEDLEQFAYAASHDLKEPLRGISVYTQLLALKYADADEETARFVEFIVSGARRMDSLLRALLEYSRAGEGVLTGRVSSSRALADALRNLKPSIDESEAEIIADEPLPLVVFPKAHLVDLFQNLIGNAIKYRGPEPLRIHISVVRGEVWHQFAIADNGIGMKREYLQRIFGVFKRLHKEEYPGVGVGLAIAKRIVERQGGRIWAESSPGKGATFYFTLPAAESE